MELFSGFRKKLSFLVLYCLFWLFVFVTVRLFFVLINHQEYEYFRIADFLLASWHGLRLDISVTGYFLIIPTLMLGISPWLDPKVLRGIIRWYTGILLFITCFLAVADSELYRYWGFKLDITPLLYLKTPGEAMASVGITEILLFVVMGCVLFFSFFWLYGKFPESFLHQTGRDGYLSPVFYLLLLGTLIIPIRGGTGIVPVNLSSVYFHKDQFVNHSGINVLWNVFYSIAEKNKLVYSYQFMEGQKAAELTGNLYRNRSGTVQVLKNKRPNIILIILESFSNKIIEVLGGEPGITPGINKLSKEGILFRNFYASGVRSDKGIVSIFSGFPAQPLTSIINYPSKVQELPFLLEPFHERGYASAFYYGGNLEFANLNAYLTNQHIDKTVTIKDFHAEAAGSKWGVHDHIVFERFFSDICAEKRPFFYIFFTLSSHEPYTVPMEPVFPPDCRDNMARNAFYYTDKHLEGFISKCKREPWWENTLVILVADHTSRSPGDTPNHAKEKFRIPMLWLGGVLTSRDTSIETYGSQTDIPATLLCQVDCPSTEFKYSKNLLQESPGSFAYYSFNHGFGFVTDTSYVIYDHDFGMCIESEGSAADLLLETGKAYLQVVSHDFTSY